MYFTKTGLGIIYHIGIGKTKVNEIATALKKSKSQIYRETKKLENLVKLSRGTFKLTPDIRTNLLVNNLIEYPNLIKLLSDSGLTILENIMEPTTIKDIQFKTNLKKAIIYNWMKKFQNISIIRKEGVKYHFNEKLWKNLRYLIEELKKYNDSIDKRVKPSSIIYHKNENTIIYSTKIKEEAKPTAFSAFNEYGIKILTTKYYYTISDKKQSIKDVFINALYVTEKEFDYRNLTFLFLFYLKNKKNLSKIKHQILENIKQVIKGKQINNYPTLNEMKSKAHDYGIEV